MPHGLTPSGREKRTPRGECAQANGPRISPYIRYWRLVIAWWRESDCYPTFSAKPAVHLSRLLPRLTQSTVIPEGRFTYPGSVLYGVARCWRGRRTVRDSSNGWQRALHSPD